MSKITIAGIDKAQIVQALYNSAKLQGLGFLHFTPEPLTYEEAQQYVNGYIDYLHGRVMKIDITGDTLDTYLYDRNNRQGAAHIALTDANLLS